MPQFAILESLVFDSGGGIIEMSFDKKYRSRLMNRSREHSHDFLIKSENH